MSDASIYQGMGGSSGSSSSTLNGFQQQNEIAMRMRALTRVNPYMGQRPDALYALATSPLSNNDLMDHGAAMFGLQASDSMKGLLEGMSPAAQRATWQALTPAQQQSLNQQGFKPAERDEDSIIGMIGRPIGMAGHAVLNVVTETADFLQVDRALDAMIWLGDQPAHLYRAIRTMDDGSQWAALAGAALGIGAVAFSPLTGGGSLAALGALGMGGLLGGTVAAAATNPGDWYTAWVDSANGERTFDRAARRKAEDILGDPRLLNLAHDIAWALPDNYSLSTLAAEMAGNRDVSIESQVARLEEVASKFATKGTNEFQRVMTGMVQLIQAPQFQAAVQTLQNGKISIGRDLADTMGFDPGTRWHSLVSGGVDGVLMFAIDPLLIAGRVGQYSQFMRRGMKVLDGEAAAQRFFHIYESEQGVQKMHKAIAAAVEAGDYRQMRLLAPTMKERWRDLLSYRDELVRTGRLKGREFGVEDFHTWMVNMMHMKPLMEGFGTVRGLNNGVVLASIGRHNEAWRAVAGRIRSFTDGLTDVKFEKNLLEQLAAGGDEALRSMLPETVFHDVARHAATGERNKLAIQVRDEVEAFHRLEPKRLEALEKQAAAQGEAVIDVLFPGHSARATQLHEIATAAGKSANYTVDDITPELLRDFALRNEQYAWSRMFGRTVGQYAPGASSMGELFTKMTTMVPAGQAIHLVGYQAPEDIKALTELAGLTGMPQWLRREWADMMLWQPTVGLRMSSMQSFVDAMLTSAGIRSLPEGEALADRYLKRIFQSYAGGGLDTLNIGGRTSKQTIYLDEMADAIPMPNLTELRQAVKGGLIAKAIGIADLPVLEQFQTKVWKPSVLLRFGFIPRAAGEEFLNYMLRGGFGSLGQELAGRSIARQEKYLDLIAAGKRGKVIDGAADLRLLAEGPMPAGTRAVSRILARHEWADPVTHVLERYSTFYRSLLEGGLGLGDEASAMLTRIAGSEFPLYELADNVQDLNRARQHLDAPLRARLNLARTVDSLMFGNPLSWRRMMAGGVNDDIVEAAYQFFGHNGTSVMRAVGASNAGPYDPGSTRQDHVRIRIEDDVNGAPQYADYVTVRGQRTLRLNTDPFFANAAHEQAQRVMADELHRTVFRKHVARTIPAHVDPATLPPLLDAFHGTHSNIARDILAEFLLEPNWTRWEAMLHHLQRLDSQLADHLSKTITRSNLSLERVSASIFDAASNTFNVGWDMISRDLTRWNEHAAFLDSLNPSDRAFYAQFITNNDAEFGRSLREYLANPMIDNPGPNKVLYRGFSSGSQMQVFDGPDGPVLRIYGQKQTHFNDLSISLTDEMEQAAEYAGLTKSERAEFNLMAEIDADYILDTFGAEQRVPSDMMQAGGLWPEGELAQFLPSGAYRIGGRGEVNVKLRQSVRGVPDVESDEAIDALIATFQDQFRPAITESGIADAERRAENYGALGPEDDVESTFIMLHELPAYLEQLKSVPAADRAAAYQGLMDRVDTSNLPHYMDAMGSSFHNRWNEIMRPFTSSGPEYVDIPAGRWRIRSQYTEEPDVLQVKLDALDQEISQVESELRWSRANGTWLNNEPPDDYVYWKAELQRLKQQRDTIYEQIGTQGSAAGRFVELNEASDAAKFYRSVQQGLNEMTDDELIALLIGGSVSTTNSDVAHTFGLRGRGASGVRLPDMNGRYDISKTMSEAGVTQSWASYGSDAPRWRQPRGTYLKNVDAPTHHTFDPLGSVVKTLADRWKMTVGEAADQITPKITERILALSTDDARAMLDEVRSVRWEPDSAGEMLADSEVHERLIAVLGADVREVLNRSRRTTFGSPASVEDLEKWRTPWHSVDELSAMAMQGLTWGSKPARRPFYTSWDEMAEGARRDMANAMHDPYYASRFGHMQGLETARTGGQADNVPFGMVLPQHENMVTAWVPRVSFYDEVPTFDELTMMSTNRSLMFERRSEVEAWLEEARLGDNTAVFADRALADLLGDTGNRWLRSKGSAFTSESDDLSARALDMPRVLVADTKGLSGVRQIAGSADHPLVWSIDGDAWRSGAVGYVRTPDATMDDWAEMLADRMIGRARQVWTKGNKEHLKPRTRTLDDGTVQTVVQSEGLNGLEHVPVDDKILQRETFYDHNGERIEFGDENYFERVMENGDGDIMWQLVGPIMMDAADEVAGRSLFAGKSIIPEVGERLPDQKELVRAYRSKVQDAIAEGADLPNMVDSPVLATYKRSRWDEFVRKGFDEVIGPSIDALARRPMAFHFFSQRYIQNKALRQWLRDPALTGRIQTIADRLAGTTALDARDVQQLAEYSRTLARYTDGAENATQWSDVHALGWLRGHADNGLPKMIDDAMYRMQTEVRQGLLASDEARDLEFALNKLRQRDVKELRTALPHDFPADDLLAYVRSQVIKDTLTDKDFFDINAQVIADHPLLSKLNEKEWDTIIAGEKNWQHIVRESGETAAVAAINDMLPFIDSHEFKTQFAEYGKGFLPFWYAEENFMKRWARTLILEGPPVIRKAQLTYMGLKTAGVVRTDPNGKDWFVYPGSNLLQEAINQIPGLPDLPVGVMFQSPTDMMLPGVNSRFGSPQFGPLVTVPLDLLTVPFPELKSMERDLVGDLGASKSALDQLVPAVVANTYNAITGDDGYQRYASAQLAAIAQLQAEGKGLPDNATPGQVDEFLRTVRNHARIIVLSQAMGGWFAPGPVSQIVTGEESQTLGALGGLLGDGIEDPGSVLSSLYSDLVRNLGIEQGTIEYLKLAPLTDVGEMFNYTTDPDTGEMTYLDGQNPLAYTTAKQASVSGAPLPATEQALAFFDANTNYMDEFPNAGPWLLPIDPNATTAHSQYAYDQQTINGLRRRRTPEEFLTQIKFKEASTRYFAMRSEYMTMVDQARTANDAARVAQLNETWKQWSTTYKAAHPIFAQTLEGSDARERRRKVIAEMRIVARDPKAPQPPHYPVLQQMVTSFDQYLTMKAEKSLDGSAKGRIEVEKLKARFEAYMEDIVLTNPAVQSFWTGVLRPESELE